MGALLEIRGNFRWPHDGPHLPYADSTVYVMCVCFCNRCAGTLAVAAAAAAATAAAATRMELGTH